jgi:hypothetical protein
MTRIKATEDFLGLHVDDVEQATGQRPEAGKNTVLRLPGRGWGGSLDGWAADLELALGCVDLLRPNLAPVIDAAIEFHESQREGLGPLDVTICFNRLLPGSCRRDGRRIHRSS